MSTPAALVARFAALFAGYEHAHGRYEVDPGAAPGAKAKGRARTVPEPATLDVYRAHLEGDRAGLGVIMLRADDRVHFAAVDYDERTVDHEALCRAVTEAGLPLVVCRSKSGGAHLYAFFLEPAPALKVRADLEDWAARLGLPVGVEVFPKQTTRVSEKDLGNWINLPYHNATATDRFGYDEGGVPLDLPAFLDRAERARFNHGEFAAPAPPPPPAREPATPIDAADPLWGAPPCLRTLMKLGGFPEGTRNDGMLATAIYLQKRFPDAWRGRLTEYSSFMCPPGNALPATELVQIERSVGKKSYKYPCRRPPLAGVCEAKLCARQTYGVPPRESEPPSVERLVGLTRYEFGPQDPPMWAFEVADRRVMVEHADFYSRDRLNMACLAQANVVPVQCNQATWLAILNELVKRADVVPAPEEAGPTGALWERVMWFLDSAPRALTVDELVNGRLLLETQPSAGPVAVFRSVDLFDFFRSRMVAYKEQQLWNLLGSKGGSTRKRRVAGRVTSVWEVPYEPREKPSTTTPPVPGAMAGEEF